MVNFDDTNTIGTPAVDIVRVLVLEKRTNVIEVLETINKREAKDSFDNGLLKARLQSLFWEIQGMLIRKEKADEIKKIIFSEKPSYKDLVEAFSTINQSLDTIRLTRIDTKTQVDTRRVKNVNDHI